MLETLQQRWNHFANQITLPRAGEMWAAIDNLYTAPDRHYHNIHHLYDCLEKWDKWPEKPEQTAEIELAIWFHDIIYDPQRNDNEESSAALLSHFLRGHMLESETVALIMATQHKEAQGMIPEEIICDIDLSILGSPSTIYQQYADAIRLEYHWVPAQRYAVKRIQVLKNFLRSHNIYHTQYAQELWQQQAVINLESEIASLEPFL